jgi:serine/threonine protein kinase
MVTDLDPVSKAENPFTGNDRFVFYEDGGRPMDIQLQAGWRPTLAAVENIARQLVEVLSYLRVKKVVHRKLSLGTIVRNEHDDVKLISLGEAKYIGKLDYEGKVQAFAHKWKGVPDDDAGRHRTSHSPPRPSAQTQNKTTKKYDCAHPASRCSFFSISADSTLSPTSSHAWQRGASRICA